MALLKNSEEVKSNLGLNSNTKLQETVTLINDTFSPIDAKKTIGKIIDEQANYKVLQNLSNWIGNQNEDISDMDKLILEKERIESLIQNAQQNGYKVEIQGSFTLRVVK